MKIGLIGYGSIGKRHVKNLIALGYKDIVLFREKGTGNEHGLFEFTDYKAFINNKFDFIIVSNPTALHYKYLKHLVETNQNILTEKPIVQSLTEVKKLTENLKNYAGIGMVAYNTRFHPCVKEVQTLINTKIIGRPLYARFYIGQYLPGWRPATDYRTSVSAKRSLGGGVASELIHEVDLAIEYFGEPAGKVHSLITKVSDLQIETEDTADYMYISRGNADVVIHTDYFYRGYKRYFEIIGSEANIFCDLYTAKITVTADNNNIILEREFSEFQRNDMYMGLLKYYIACLEDKIIPKPSLQEGLISVKLVEESKINNGLS